MPKTDIIYCEICYEEDCICLDEANFFCEGCRGDRRTCDCTDEVVWSDDPG